ncbi:MAG: EcsC family protein [Ilumatobacter sp.]|uniref:EcsC family protein n=1 Tax=Ilumatobacter sp. TaxID=1967498 RepID=UPI00261838DA|nr:EcsC family protein [Ilumatobacter sp.]MDJ0771594.1 EcsC family protein [Ilumatobacter sp.]
MPVSDRLNAKASEWATRLVDRLGPEEAQRLSRSMLASIDDVSQHRWEQARRRAESVGGTIRPEKIAAVTASFSRELGAAGAAAGAAAAAPAVGTAATIAATTAELGWFTARAGDLILTIAALHGMPDPSVDERRAWVLAVLIYGSSARDEFARALQQASTGLAPSGDGRLRLSTLQTANRLMGRALVRRYGTRRGAVAVGRLLPIGIGAAIGGSVNYLAIRALARQADAFFARLPYSAIDVESTDLTGRMIG